jgi:alpha-amylase/alpha-mannosidase (GH57 family)
VSLNAVHREDKIYSAKQLNPSLLKNLVSSQQAKQISTTCNLTLQKNDKAIMAQLETAPLPPSDVP